MVSSASIWDTCSLLHLSNHPPYRAKIDLKKVVRWRSPLSMFTYSESLFNLINKRSQPQEMRPTIDLQYVRDSYSTEEISDVCIYLDPKILPIVSQRLENMMN